MHSQSGCRFKVWAFLKRNSTLLTHDQYRAGHVGFHCGNTRRLKAIRGYTVNIHNDDHGFGERLASHHGIANHNEPAEFLDLWDGLSAVHFDDRQQWTEAVTLEPTRATADGLAIDSDWTLSDGPFLFDRIDDTNTQFRSYHTRVHEAVIQPVLRAEARPCKLLQFFKASPALGSDQCRERMVREYLPLCAQLDGLQGLIANFRDADIDAAVSGYYPQDHWCFSAAGRAFRERFYALWHGANELFFDSLEAFIDARLQHPYGQQLETLERKLFDSLWYVAVDENMIVMPNRLPAPDFYYR